MESYIMFFNRKMEFVKMLIPLKLMHRFNVVPIKIPKTFHSLQVGSKFIMEEQSAKNTHEETWPIRYWDFPRQCCIGAVSINRTWERLENKSIEAWSKTEWTLILMLKWHLKKRQATELDKIICNTTKKSLGSGIH